MVLLELSYGNFPCILVNALVFTASKEYRFCLLKMNQNVMSPTEKQCIASSINYTLQVQPTVKITVPWICEMKTLSQTPVLKRENH